jgi:hypothetical protein
VKNLKREQDKYTNTQLSSDNQSSFDDSGEIYMKSTKYIRNLTIRELEDHLIELKHKKLNISGTISKLLTKYCTECLDGERTMTIPVRESYMKRIAELEAIYFDKKQTTGFPSLGVIAILIDYCKYKRKKEQIRLFLFSSKIQEWNLILIKSYLISIYPMNLIRNLN